MKQFHRWTHDCLDAAIVHAGSLPPEALLRELPAFGHSSIRDQLEHVFACEDTWVRALQGLPPRDWLAIPYPSAAALREARQAVASETIGYLDRLTEADLNRDVENVPAGWTGPRRSPAYILHHVLTHAFHHKGQLVSMFRMLAHPAPDTDLQRSF
jgi:uncharacterized damage-inducible protein DinB